MATFWQNTMEVFLYAPCQCYHHTNDDYESLCVPKDIFLLSLVCLQRWIKVIVNLEARKDREIWLLLYFFSHLHTYKISGIISIHFYGKTGISRHGCCCVYAYDVILLLLLLKRYLTCHKLPNHCIGLMSIFCRIWPVFGNIIDLTQKLCSMHTR